MKKEIIYPKLLECCQYAYDIFWENIFEDLAYGKPPYGTYISKDFLCCSYKNKDFNYKLEQDKPVEQIFKDINDLLTRKLGILSFQDKMTKHKEFNDFELHMKETRSEWQTIKKKNIKELLIEIYVINLKKKHSLTWKRARILLSIIFLSFIFKTISPGDIEYENGEILHINGIHIKNGEISQQEHLYTIDDCNKAAETTKKKAKNKLAARWEKYIKELDKKFN